MRKSIPVNENRVSLPVKVPSLRGNDEKHIILTVSDQDRNIQSLLEYIRDISSHGHSFYIEVDSVYKERIKDDIFTFIKEIDALGKEIYLNYVDGIDGYKIEPLLFQNQKDNLKDYKVNNIEEY